MRDMEDLVESGQGRNPSDVIQSAIILVCCLGLALAVVTLMLGTREPARTDRPAVWQKENHFSPNGR